MSFTVANPILTVEPGTAVWDALPVPQQSSWIRTRGTVLQAGTVALGTGLVAAWGMRRTEQTCV